jgi:hypothetical protein
VAENGPISTTSQLNQIRAEQQKYLILRSDLVVLQDHGQGNA